jgi:hypothetical protein
MACVFVTGSAGGLGKMAAELLIDLRKQTRSRLGRFAFAVQYEAFDPAARKPSGAFRLPCGMRRRGRSFGNSTNNDFIELVGRNDSECSNLESLASRAHDSGNISSGIATSWAPPMPPPDSSPNRSSAPGTYNHG